VELTARTQPRALLLDVDGCLVLADRPGGDGGEVFPGAVDLLERARAAGLPFLLFTNASTLTPEAYAGGLRSLGLPVDDSQVMTPGVVAARFVAARYPSQPVLVFGGSGVADPLRAQGNRVIDIDEHEVAAAVLVSFDLEFSARKLDAACRAVQRGAELLVTSDARWFAGRHGAQVGVAGAIAAGITHVTGVPANVMGKPSGLAMREVLGYLDVDARDLVVVGDDVALEIRMGNAAGSRTVLVLTGMTSREQAMRLPENERPDEIVDGIWDLVQLLDRDSGWQTSSGVDGPT
jgi:HAD superfamily hydrolase (TIGR01450 family)